MRVIKFLLPFAFFVKGDFVFAQSSQELIKINQSGYYPAAPKIAIVASDYSNDEYAGSNFGFYILKLNSTDTVYKNSLGPVRQSINSSLKTRLADFSAFQQVGKYLLFIPGIGTSYPFEINQTYMSLQQKQY